MSDHSRKAVIIAVIKAVINAFFVDYEGNQSGYEPLNSENDMIEVKHG